MARWLCFSVLFFIHTKNIHRLHNTQMRIHSCSTPTPTLGSVNKDHHWQRIRTPLICRHRLSGETKFLTRVSHDTLVFYLFFSYLPTVRKFIHVSIRITVLFFDFTSEKALSRNTTVTWQWVRATVRSRSVAGWVEGRSIGRRSSIRRNDPLRASGMTEKYTILSTSSLTLSTASYAAAFQQVINDSTRPLGPALKSFKKNI